MPTFIDTHAHLEMDAFAEDRDAVIDRAVAAGVSVVITVGTNLADDRRAIALAQQYPSVVAAVGIHPHDVSDTGADTYDILKVLACSPEVVAYGEIGLDFFRNRRPRELQIRHFGLQLELAAELGLPVIVHDREAHAEVLGMLSPYRGRKVVIHCFSGDCVLAARLLDWGFFLSVDGPVTYPKSQQLAEVVRFVPLERLFLETDAPYLTPQPLRGKRNEPSYLLYTAAQVARVKGVPLETVAAVTTTQAASFFGLPSSAPGGTQAP